MRNPFKVGDYVEDGAGFCWQVKEVSGNQILVSDVGYEVSNVIQLWEPHDDYKLWVDDDEEFDD